MTNYREEWVDMEDPIELAIAYATVKHAGQKDKAGEPYILHCLTVGMQGTSVEEILVGLLHDTIEDTDAHFSEIEQIFGERVADCVVDLTKGSTESYEEYIDALINDSFYRTTVLRVKERDLMHNMQLERLPEITEKDIQRQVKYAKALKRIRSVLYA